MIKNMDKKSKILNVVGMLLIIILICIFFISKFFNTTSSVNETEQNITKNTHEQLDYKYFSFSGYKELYNSFNSEEINKYYSIYDKEYHIAFKDDFDNIVVNDTTIFDSKNKIISLDLYNNIRF